MSRQTLVNPLPEASGPIAWCTVAQPRVYSSLIFCVTLRIKTAPISSPAGRHGQNTRVPFCRSKRTAMTPLGHRILSCIIAAIIAFVGLLTINLFPYRLANSQPPLGSQFRHEPIEQRATIGIEPAPFWD
jgi:hypothetical protein